MTDRVDAVRDEIAAMGDDWDMIDALLGGTRAMRAAGTRYLPQHPAENIDFYNYRKSVSTLFNGFGKTVETMSAKPFSEPIKCSSDMPVEIRGVDATDTAPRKPGWIDDIGLDGRDLHAFSHEVFRTALAYGLSHILVDYPDSPGVQTVAQQRSSGARPYFVHIKPRQILGWRSERINGAETLTQLRILESVEENNGNWEVQTVEQIRVVERDNFALYRKNDKGVWLPVAGGPISIGMIPLATVYTGRTGFMTATPPLLDLANLNVEHWQSSSDQSNILHVARVPILFGSGFDESDKIIVGTQKAVSNDNPDAKLMYVEHTGAAIDAGRESIQDIEDRMRVLGAQLLVRDQAGNRTTATEKSIDSAEADSALSLGALNLQDSLNLAFSYMAKWENMPSAGSVTVYRDFDEATNQSAKGDVLMKMRQEGCVSAQTVFEEAQTFGVVGEERKWSDELTRFKEEGPIRAVIGNYEGTPGSGQPVAGGAPAQ